MREPTLFDAYSALHKRKVAIFGEPDAGTAAADEEHTRLLLVGTGVTADDLLDGVYTLKHLSEGLYDDPAGALASGWMDGVLTGLMLVELRKQAEAGG